jgi:hypothetical protein
MGKENEQPDGTDQSNPQVPPESIGAPAGTPPMPPEEVDASEEE